MNKKNIRFDAVAKCLVVVLAVLGAACDSDGDARDLQNRVEVAAGGYTSIKVSSTNSTIEVGQQQPMVLAALSDEDVIGTTVTGSAVWSVSDSSVASITQSGVLTGLADGTVNVNVRYGPLFTATTIRVSEAELAAIEVVVAEQSIDECSSVQLEARGNYGDGESRILTDLVTWAEQSTTTVGSFNVSDDAGLYRTTSAGTVSITATRNGVVSDPPLNLTVLDNLASISIPAATAVLTTSNSVQLSARATYTDSASPDTAAVDITDNVSWSSGSTSIATVDNTLPSKGRVDAIRNGSVTISAACGGAPNGTLAMLAGDPTVVETVFFSRSSPFDITFNSERQIELRSFVRLETQEEVEITEDSDWTFVNQGNSQNELNNNEDFKGILTIRGTGRIVVQVEYIGDVYDETDGFLNTPRLEINVR